MKSLRELKGMCLFVAVTLGAVGGCAEPEASEPDRPRHHEREEEPPVPATPRALMVNEPEALSAFTLERVLGAILETSEVEVHPGRLYQRWWDAFNRAEAPHELGIAPQTDVAHCDETSPPAAVNGFPITCPRGEGNFAAFGFRSETHRYHPVAVVNRFDLAPADGAHCGEYRLVLAKDPRTSMEHYLIFEAVLPNPHVEEGLEGCRGAAQLWRDLEDPALDAAAVGERLSTFFFTGIEGFPAVLRAEHLGLRDPQAGVSSPGRIRSNTLADTWQLREFAPVRRCEGASCSLEIVSVPVADTPFAPLFAGADPRSELLEGALVEQLDRLVGGDPNQLGWSAPAEVLAGESNAQSEPPEDFQVHAAKNQGLHAKLKAKLGELGSSLSSNHVLARATSQTCAGCHELSSGADLGGGLVWPRSLGFVHVNHRGAISPALRDVFLPHRREVLEGFLGAATRR